MIDPTEAIEIARKQLVHLMGSTELQGLQPRDLTLEEVELADQEKTWDVTLGYPVPDPLAKVNQEISDLNRFLRGVPLKKFKVLRIDRATGNLISMKNISA